MPKKQIFSGSTRYLNYPLKVYLNADKSVILSYTGLFYKNEFEVQDITCLISKDKFYKHMEDLKKRGQCLINTDICSIKITVYNETYELVVSNYEKEITIVKEDRYFINWLLSINLRKSNRIKADIPVSFDNGITFGYGVIRDMSIGGFKLELKQKLDVDEKIWISIFDEKNSVSNCICKIRRAIEEENSYIYGIEIDEIDNNNNYNLENLIEDKKE